MLDYSRRHHLSFSVPNGFESKFDGKDEFDFADLTDAQLADERSLAVFRRIATIGVIAHFRRTTDAMIKVDNPVSLHWKRMLVIWSADDFEEKYERYQHRGTWKTIWTFITEAMNECLPEGCERRMSLEWWWSQDKNEVRICLRAPLALMLNPGTIALLKNLPSPTVIPVSPRR